MNFECYFWNTHSRCTMFTWATCNDDRLSTVLFFFVNTVICFSKSITVTDSIHMLLLSTWIVIKSINSEYWIHLHHCSMVTFSRVKVFERNHRFFYSITSSYKYFLYPVFHRLTLRVVLLQTTLLSICRTTFFLLSLLWNILQGFCIIIEQQSQ